MPVYDRNLLPDTYDSNWTLSGATRINSNTGIRFSSASGYARYSYNTTGFEATGYMLITCANVVGDVFICIEYVDAEDEVYDSHVVKLSTGMSLAIILQEATVDSTITFTLYTSIANSQVGLVEALLMEQAIRSVDIEYASGTSRVTPPEEGWSTTAPQWQTGYYIWQRTATTFVDGHTEYSDPICIQNTESAGIYAIEEQYYLSTSSTTPTGGSWSTDQPTWQSSMYIWTRSKITWTDQTVTYSEAVLAQALNQANEHAQEAIDAVEDLDKDLDQDGIFNRLTNDGKAQGLFLNNGDVYFNATYINAGILTVRDTSGDVLFRASIDSKNVFLAGFTAAASSLYVGSIRHLNQVASGVYIGTDGITTGDTASYVTLTAGRIEGGRASYSRTGYISFRNILVGQTDVQGMRIAATGFIVIYTPRIGVGDYPEPSATAPTTWTTSGSFSSGLVKRTMFETHGGVPYNLRISNGNLLYGAYTPTAVYPQFSRGLLVSAPE